MQEETQTSVLARLLTSEELSAQVAATVPHIQLGRAKETLGKNPRTKQKEQDKGKGTYPVQEPLTEEMCRQRVECMMGVVVCCSMTNATNMV